MERKFLVKRAFIKDINKNGKEIFDDESILNELNDYFANCQFSRHYTENTFIKFYKPFEFPIKDKYKYEEIVTNIYSVFEYMINHRSVVADILNCNVVTLDQLYILFGISCWYEDDFKKYLNNDLCVFNTHIKAITNNTFVCSWKNLLNIINNYNF